MVARASSRPRVRGQADVVRSRARAGETPRERVTEIQRSRLLAAALGAIEELGYSRVTVAHIAARARVSRRTFYQLFDNREDCLLAALESVVDAIRDELMRAELDGLPWRERVRGGLWTVLSFFEREPVLARVLVVQALRGGVVVLERREQILTELAGVINAGCEEGARAAQCAPVTAEGVVGGVFTVVYARLLRGEEEPLTSLFGELMGLIVLPYFGVAAARREQRGTRVFSSGGNDRRVLPSPVRLTGLPFTSVKDPLAGLPMRLTYRTALVLEAIASQPGVSNRMVAQLAEISDQGQVSKLLARLGRLGLIENTGAGRAKGEPNAWVLTAKGQQVAQRTRLGVNGEQQGR